MATVPQQPRINRARGALISAVSLMAAGFVGLLAYAQPAVFCDAMFVIALAELHYNLWCNMIVGG